MFQIGGYGGFGGNAGAVGVAPSATASQMAFGPGYLQSGTPGLSSTLSPNDPFGVAFWLGVTAVVLLAVVRHSLPR